MNEIAAAAAAEAAVAGPAGPYPGLRPFLPAERDIFFGREQMIDDVLVRLDERRMVVVHGTSGCGKSSLIAAGVLLQLKQRRARSGRRLAMDTFSPGAKPMQALVEKLREMCGGKDGPASLETVYRAISDGAEARANVSRMAIEAGLDQLCIVVDQFEELFRFAEEESSEEARNFAELLVQLAGYGAGVTPWWQEERAPSDAPPDVISFILTMRSEFLGNCARFRGLAEAINETQYLLPNMARADLIRAIREPAEVFGGTVEHRLAERMADDALREEDSLPLVQHALLQLWQRSDGGVLTLEDYQRGVEACTPCAEARRSHPLGATLAAHADQVLGEAATDDASRAAAEFIFRALTKKDSESRAIRCPQKLRRLYKISGVSEERTREIIDAFRREGASFLTPYASVKPRIDGGDMIDISHEALIRTWPQMSDRAIDQDSTAPIGWVEREAQAAMLWRWVSVQADLFQSNPKAYLDLATNRRISAWFDRIRTRPEWARPYLVKPATAAQVADEPEWQAVERLLKESLRKTWLDRILLRWWKVGGATLTVLSIALIAVLVIGWNYADNQLHILDRLLAREGDRDHITSSLAAGNQALAAADKRVGMEPASAVEVLDDSAAAALIAGGSFINTPDGRGFVWIGSTAPGRQPEINLNRARQPVPPDRPPRVGRVYRMAGNTVVRGAAPGADPSVTSVGFVARDGQVRILGPATPVVTGARTDYWAQVSLARTDLPTIRMYLANVSASDQAQMVRQLGAIGYHPTRRTGIDATNRADVVYCRPESRRAAVQFATTVTRWIAENMRVRGITLAPLAGDSCEGVDRNELMLVLDLAPTPTPAPAAEAF